MGLSSEQGFQTRIDGSIQRTKHLPLEETFKRLDEIFPGPGGEAPKAYAW